MKHSRCAAFLVLASTLALLANCSPKETKKSEVRVSRPFQYSGYSYPEYKSYVKKSEYVEMKDGTKLAVDIFLPSDGPEKKSFPVVFEYTPYSRAYVLPSQTKWYVRLGVKKMIGTSGPVLDSYTLVDTVKLLLKHGYAFACADMRGTGASFGWKLDFMTQLGEDGAELVNWLGRQPWSDGNVGMFGGSYLGYSQIVTAGRKPKALKCIFPEVVPLDGYTGEAYPGGIYLNGMMTNYSTMLNKINQNYYIIHMLETLKAGDPFEVEFSLPAAPVVDEDGDGDLADEIPLDLNGNGTFLDDYKYPEDPNDPPQYKDGKPRKHIYFLATKEHLKNLDYNSWAATGYFIDGASPRGFEGFTSYDLSPSAQAPGIMESGIAVYNHGGWHDAFVRGATELYSTMKKTNPSRMIIDAGFHPGTGPYWKYLGENIKDIEAKLNIERLRFFDRYLKGIQNGIEKEPPIVIYVQNGGGWRMEKEWPLARQVMTDYLFGANNSLGPQKHPDGSDSYKADFTHDSSYGKYNGNRFMALMGVVPHELEIRTEKDKSCLTYTSAPMAENTEVTGHPIVDLWASSTADRGDFFVYLEDVDEKGEVLLVTEGMLRAGFAKLVDNNKIILDGAKNIDVLPKLPWHGYRRADFVDNILAKGNIVRLYFDLFPTSWVFRKGHRVRVTIACANWPTFRLDEKLAPHNKPDDPANVIPTITVYRDAKHQSLISLPIIPIR